MTNDGWWDKTAGHKQHLHFARLRAVETRRDVARSANTGISAFIDQKGKILRRSMYGEEASLKQSIRLNSEITFYSKWGDMIARISIFLSILFLLNSLVKGLMKNPVNS